ncbi:MAG TPA: dihydropteroate synthase [Solirubrobacteraceae bacterium]|nr:dihydropteroate synthase [Solirubrobacteraceae bacterium]
MRPYRVMGILNVTPDSFSDGGRFLDAGAAIAHARQLLAEGADILDVGGESTRPGAEPVPEHEELARVRPVLEGLAQARIPASAQISIDTCKAAVARTALEAGASIVNDVSALRADAEMVGLVAESGAQCCLMHMLGEPRTMQRAPGPQYTDVVDEVKAFLEQRLRFAVEEGIREQRILLDPGIGFGKTVEHNLQLLARLNELASIGPPVVIGTSRKSFLDRIRARGASETEPAGTEDRLPATIASNVLAYERGASVLRVHDVAAVRAALAVAAATLDACPTARGMTQTS